MENRVDQKWKRTVQNQALGEDFLNKISYSKDTLFTIFSNFKTPHIHLSQISIKLKRPTSSGKSGKFVMGDMEQTPARDKDNSQRKLLSKLCDPSIQKMRAKPYQAERNDGQSSKYAEGNSHINTSPLPIE